MTNAGGFTGLDIAGDTVGSLFALLALTNTVGGFQLPIDDSCLLTIDVWSIFICDVIAKMK